MEESYLGRCSCIYCHEVKSVKGIFTHVDRSHLGLTKYCQGNNGNYSQVAQTIREKTDKKIEEYLKSPSHCEWCKDVLLYKNRHQRFCGHSCSANFNSRIRLESGMPWHSEESIEKIRQKRIEQIPPESRPKSSYVLICSCCGNEFESKTRRIKFCSTDCRKNSKRSGNGLRNYRLDAAFKFNLSDFPDEFDFSLVEQFGWYKAKNRGDNQNGVSRDHLLSVRHGYDNNIDPKIIAHPANCRLMRHSKNVSKGSKCDILLEELLIKITEWDIKYL
jgi:hypothetical protein